MKSVALATPMCCTSSHWPPSSGSRPKRSVADPMRAERAAIRKSQASAKLKPVWMAKPLTAETVSLSSRRTAVFTAWEIVRRLL